MKYQLNQPNFLSEATFTQKVLSRSTPIFDKKQQGFQRTKSFGGVWNRAPN